MRRIQGLDGIRCLAVVAVVAAHSHVDWLHGGGYGVDVFFVLSGYLITLLLLSEHAKFGRIHLGLFWARRALRLLPALVLLVILVDSIALFRPAWLGPYPDSTLSATPGVLFYFSNWLIVAQNGPALGAFGPLWSLSVEEQFYLVWPIVVIIALRLRRPLLALALVCVGLIAAVSIARFVFYDPLSLYAGFATTSRVDTLLYGVLLAVVFRAGRSDTVRRVTGWLVWPAIGWLVVAVVVQPEFGEEGGPLGYLMHTIGGPAVALSACAIIGYVVTRQESLLTRALALPPLEYLGRISYGMYLWHYPALILLQVWFGLGTQPNVLFLAGLAATVAAASVSWFALERPLSRRFHSRLSPSRTRARGSAASS